ncbi:hypothetical protein MMC13_005285 [Lambiella insularis]|nr:hypothetical protein [Lambiella insularis]
MSASEALCLCLPEVLENILESLEWDKKSLLNACLVNCTWFEEGTSILWREAPASALLKLPSNRRQIYASKMAKLAVKDITWPVRKKITPKDKKAILALRFPRLKDLEFGLDSLGSNSFHASADRLTRHLLQYRIKRLQITDTVFQKELLNSIFLTCPRLAELVLHSVEIEGLNPLILLKFLQKYTSLTSIMFGQGSIEHSVNHTVLAHLMERSTLKTLLITRLYGEKSITQAMASTSGLRFENIDKLKLQIRSIAVPLLLPALGNVKSLTLRVFSTACPVLNHLSTLRQLEELDVQYASRTEIPVEEVKTLRNLVNLRTLNIWPPWGKYIVESNDLTDEDFEETISCLGELTLLTFQILSDNLGAESFKSLAKHCKKLEGSSTAFGGSYNMFDGNQTVVPMFPRLRYWEMGHLTGEGTVSAKELAFTLRNLAPSLDDFALTASSKFSKVVTQFINNPPDPEWPDATLRDGYITSGNLDSVLSGVYALKLGTPASESAQTDSPQTESPDSDSPSSDTAFPGHEPGQTIPVADSPISQQFPSPYASETSDFEISEDSDDADH